MGTQEVKLKNKDLVRLHRSCQCGDTRCPFQAGRLARVVDMNIYPTSVYNNSTIILSVQGINHYAELAGLVKVEPESLTPLEVFFFKS